MKAESYLIRYLKKKLGINGLRGNKLAKQIVLKQDIRSICEGPKTHAAKKPSQGN